MPQKWVDTLERKENNMSGGYKPDSGVYIITNNINNKFYIGSCVSSMKQRMTNHKNDLRQNKHRNTYLQRAFNKYGEDSFDFDTLENHDPEFCVPMEQFWMNTLNVCNRSFGYNIAPVAGNSLGQKRTAQQKLNISNSLKGKRVGSLNPNYGKTWSEETREKIANSSRNKAVLKLDLNGNILEEYKSLAEAGKKNNLYSDQIGKVCNNKPNCFTAGGFKWIFKNGKV